MAVTDDPYGATAWQREKKAKPVDSAEVVELVECLGWLGSSSLQAESVRPRQGEASAAG